MQYTELDRAQDRTRVLHLRPSADTSDEISCYLTTVPLEDRTIQYEALSYVWGDQLHPRPISIDGNAFQVTENLYNAMTNIRFRKVERTLWIDAICINQKDASERSHQVTNMHYIYSQASKVLIWLGEATPDLIIAYRFFVNYGRGLGQHINASESIDEPVWSKKELSGTLLDALRAFMKTSWFSRTWTIQEWVLAQSSSFYCGQYLLPGEWLKHAIHTFIKHTLTCCKQEVPDQLPSMLYQTFHPLTSMEALRGAKRDAISVLSDFRHRQASDPRDKLYGLLALFSREFQARIEPDYTLPVAEVYTSWTLALITESGTLDVLSQLPPHQPSTLAVPSWVTDWGMTLDYPEHYEVSGLLERSRHLALYKACNGATAQIIPEPMSLLVKGRSIDTVRRIVHIAEYESPGAQWVVIPKKYTRLLVHPFSKHDYWQFLSGSLKRDVMPRKYVRRHRMPSEYLMIPQESLQLIPSVDVLPGRVLRLRARPDGETLELFTMVSSGRNFVVTEHGRIGYAPKYARIGDSIVLLAGASVPIILRACESTSFKVIGDAYIHEVMDGEAWPTRDEDLHTFRLI